MKSYRAIILMLMFPAFLVFAGTSSPQGAGLKVGDNAPEISLPNTQGAKMTLSELEGKVVLIDFWASWCKPCRVNHPELVNAYRKYKNVQFKGGEDGFAVYSVSLDTDRSSWLKAIEQDRMEWNYHVSDLKGWKSPVVGQYKVSAIPHSFLIGGDGKIIRKNIAGKVDEFLAGYRK